MDLLENNDSENSNAVDLALLSDFNIDLLGRYLSNSPEFPKCNVLEGNFGQVFQSLLSAPKFSDNVEHKFAVIWCKAQHAVPEYTKCLEGELVDFEKLEQEIDSFTQAISSFAEQFSSVIVVAWHRDFRDGYFGLQEWAPNSGPSNILATMNLRLSSNLDKSSNTFLIDPQRWVKNELESTVREKLWYTTKVPFSNSVFESAAKDIKAALCAVLGKSKKLLVVDLDNTLWGGVVGDDGWQNLELGGHNWRGEAYLAFQRGIKGLLRRGVQVAIVSKNEEDIALDAISSHPEMILRAEDFAGWKINWRDKAENILLLTNELNLGLDSVVFIDDSAIERQRVADALPDVFVPEWSEDPSSYLSSLNALNCFDSVQLTDEDRLRSKMYATERKRKESAKLLSSLEEWLEDLELRIEVQQFNEADQGRITQLLNKTNQMNLSTRRLSEAELSQWCSADSRDLLSVRTFDRYGEYGLSAVLSFERKKNECKFVDFLMSCRVMGRGIEGSLLHIASRYAQYVDAKKLTLKHIPTEKNKPMMSALESSSLTRGEDTRFFWDLNSEYPNPPHIEIVSDLPWLTDTDEPEAGE